MPNQPIDVSIVIVGTNEKDHVKKCLDSIRESQMQYTAETIMIDNASSDGTSQMVKKDFPWVILVENATKMGYIHNNVMGTQMSKGRYILLLNSDIALPPETLQYLLKFMDDHPEAGVSSCRLVFDDGTLQLTCRQFPTPLIYFARLPHFFRWVKAGKKFSLSGRVKDYLLMDYDHKTTRQVDWVLSALFLMRRKAIEDVGGLDNRLTQPFYLEDVEWCFRSRLKGWRTYYVPEVFAYHYYRRDSVKKFGWLSIVHILNIFKFFNKHGLAMLLKKHRNSLSPLV